MNLHYRPIDAWPGELRQHGQRESSPFTGDWASTLDILDRELWQLGAKDAVIQLAVPESTIRLDGTMRADRKPPEHPGVIVSFESRHGPLRYWTDRFTFSGYRGMREGWRHNVRAVALGLEALRKVERYGIANRGEQYRGWAELPAGVVMGASNEEPPLTAQTAAQLLAGAIGIPWGDLLGEPDTIRYAYRQAAKLLHPDTNADPGAGAKMRRLTEARDLLLGEVAA